MVFFTCSVCGESVKKVSVEKHLLTSRRCNQGSLSCMDCGKDFDSVSYKSHNACITEAAKYGGLNYKAPANANKGQQKQSEWTENVRAAISMLRESRTGSNALLRLLETISSYENVPRKKPKFMNFLRNSFSGVQETVIVAAWDAIEAAVPKKPVVSASPKASQNLSFHLFYQFQMLVMY
jgi:cell growth-regulating nucleolar protein